MSQVKPRSRRESRGSRKKINKYVVGLDFGTTFTSVVFAHSESPRDVKVVQTWPGAGVGSNSADQVPTKIDYSKGEVKWGYQVSDTRPAPGSPLKWFKLLLQEQEAGPWSTSKNRVSSPRKQRKSLGRKVTDEDARSEGQASTVADLFRDLRVSSGYGPTLNVTSDATPAEASREILRKLDMSAVQAVSDFLTKVKETTLESIKRTYWMEQELESKVEWVLTVPAIWTDSAKDRMIKATKQAGFGQVGIDFAVISEPECGATYALNVIQPSNLEKGDVFVLCDAGGGTVDLISYKIAETDPLRVDEVVAGKGALCGSVFLDQGFADYMRNTLGDKIFNSMKPIARAAMMQSWEETVKFRFGHDTPSTTYELNVPGLRDDKKLRIEEGWHKMSHTDVLTIFDPVIDRIISLVSQQVRRVRKKGNQVTAILLVGGFGSSGYLLKRLESHTYSDRKLRVLQPVNAQTAIARGALLRGFDGSIVMKRRATRFYGSTSTSRKTSLPEVQSRIYTCPRDGLPRVPDKMTWFIQKGVVIEPSCANFSRDVPITPGEEPVFRFASNLYACDLDDAPAYKWQNPSAIYRVCTLTSDLSSVPRRKFGKYTGLDGVTYYHVEYKLQMTLVDEVWKFELLFEGRCYGVVKAQYS